MGKPRIVIVDDDFSYVIPLQSKFVYEFLDDVEIEIITKESYLQEFFQNLQKIDVLVVDAKFYSEELGKHEIQHIFVMTEEQNDEASYPDDVHVIFKYTNVKGIFLEIVGISNLKIPMKSDKQDPKMILVTSASGGTGKTTIALGLATALSDMYKRVLYLEASRLQTFQYFMKDSTPIVNQQIYAKLLQGGKNIYQEIKGEFRQEKFSYMPPLKAALMSFGIDYRIFGGIAKAAKESGEYDFVIVDVDITFDDIKAKMMNLADYVLVITEPTAKSVYSANLLVSNINNSGADKYLFICNKYNVESQNVLEITDSMQYKVDEYVEKFDDYEVMKCEQFGMQESIRKIAFLLI